jgi:Tol biopolymer transport system component
MGNEITYVSSTGREWSILSKSLEPAAAPRIWVRSSSVLNFPEWSRDRRFLLYLSRGGESQGDLVYRERLGNGELSEERVFLRTPAQEMDGRFSPDGKYVAYSSDETGKGEIYVRDFPKGERRWQVSKGGGSFPRWRVDGRELYYAAGGRLMTVSVDWGTALKVGNPVRLFEKPALGLLQFDVSADGRRFVVLEKPAGETPLAVHIVQDWFEEFRGRK